MKKIFLLDDIIQTEGEDIFDWVRKIYFIYWQLGTKFKLYISLKKKKEIYNYFGMTAPFDVVLWAKTRGIEIKETTREERLEIIE